MDIYKPLDKDLRIIPLKTFSELQAHTKVNKENSA